MRLHPAVAAAAGTIPESQGWLARRIGFVLAERRGEPRRQRSVLRNRTSRGRAPARIGVFDFHNGKTSFRVASGAHVLVNGKTIITADLKSDADGTPDICSSAISPCSSSSAGDALWTACPRSAQQMPRGIHRTPLVPGERSLSGGREVRALCEGLQDRGHQHRRPDRHGAESRDMRSSR